MPKFISDVQLVGSSTDLSLEDSGQIKLGTGADLKIYHNSTISLIQNFTGNLEIRQAANDKDIIFYGDDMSGGITPYFRIDGSEGYTKIHREMRFMDNVELRLGFSGDMRIYHDENNSYVRDVGNGNLYLDTNGSFIGLISDGSFSNGKMGLFYKDGAVELYYDNSKKFETTSSGIDVTGTANIDNLTINGAQGTDGQVLTSTGSGVAWEDAPGGGTLDGSGTANDVAMWLDSDTLTDAPIAISGNNATFAGNIEALGLTFSNGADRSLTGPLNEDLIINARPNDTTEGLHLQINGTDKLFIKQDGSATFAGDVTIGTNDFTAGTATIGGILIQDSDDRSGLLEINKKGTSGWAGIQVKHDAELWSWMGNGQYAGLYDDTREDWIYLHDSDTGNTEYKWRNSTKMTITTGGLSMSGTITSRSITPETDSTYNIGTNTVRFANVYADNLYGIVDKLEITSNDSFNGTYSLLWHDGANNVFSSTFMTINGSNDTLSVPNISTTGDITVNGGDLTIAKQNDAPTITLLHDGTNPTTSDLLFKMQFQSDYDGGHQNWGKIQVTTNASSVRTNLDFYVKSTSGNEELGLRIEGGSTTPKTYIYGDLIVEGDTTTLNTQTVEVEDNILQLNTTQGSPDTATATTSGISIYRGNGVTQASFIFDDADDTWDLTNNLNVAGNTESNRYIANDGNMLQLHQDSWNSGQTDHYVLYNGWTTNTGDYIFLKSSGNQNGSNGAILISDGNSGGRVYFGLHGNQQAAVDSATAPLATTYAYIGGSANYFGANTTFAGDILPSTDSTYDLGSTSLRWANVWADNINGGSVVNGSGSAEKLAVWSDSDTLSYDDDLRWDGEKLMVESGNSSSSSKTLSIVHTRNNPNVATNAVFIDANFSGADNTTTDRTNSGLYIDLDSSADGDSADEVRTYGIRVDARMTGYNDQLYGVYAWAESNNITEKTGNIVGVYGIGVHDSSSTNGGVSNLYGVRGTAVIQDYGDVDNAYGVQGYIEIADNRNANVDIVKAVEAQIQIDEATALTYGTMHAFSAIIDNNEGSAPTFGLQYLFKGDYQGTRASGAYGIYTEGERHYLENKLGIGVTDPSEALDVSGNATFTGNVTATSSFAQNFYVTSSGTNAVNRIDNDGSSLYITYGGTSNRALEISNSNGNANFTGEVTATEYNLPSSGMLDWANGDARIIEGLVNNYSLSFQTYDGSNVTTALRLDGNNNATFDGRILSGYTGTSYHELKNATSNGTVLRLLSTGDNRILTLQTDHIYSNGAIYFGDNAHTTNFRGSGYTFSTGNAEFSGALTVVNDSGITVRTTTNGAEAKIEFSDMTADYSQKGTLKYVHADGASFGSANAFLFASSETDISIISGDADTQGVFYSYSKGSTSEVDFGFANDLNTGMYRPGADQVGLVAGGSRKLLVNSTGVLIQNGSLNVPVGSAATPSIQVGDTNTGFYDSGSDQIGFASGGSVAGTIDTTRLAVTGYVSASAFRPTNIVTNRIVKFDGTDLDDSLLSDDGSTLTYNGAQVIDVVNSGGRIGEDILFEITEADTTNSLRKKLADRSSTSITRVDDATAPAGGCFEFANRYENLTLPAFYKVDDNTEFTFEVWVKFVSGTDTDQRLYAGASFYDSSKSYLGNSQRYWGESGEQIDANSRNDGSWYHFSGTLGPNRGTNTGDIPTAAEWMKLILLLNYSGQANTVRYCGLKFYKSGGRQNRMFTSIYRKSLGSQASSANSWLGKTVMDTSGNLYTPQRLYHYDDNDTYLQFNSNEIDLNTGGTTRLQIVNDEVTIDGSCHLKLGDSGDVSDSGFLRIRHANSGDGEMISLVRSAVRTWRHQVNSSGDYEIRNVDGTYNVLTMSANSNLGIGISPGTYKLHTGTGNIRFKHQHNGTARLELFQNRQDLSNVKVWEIAAYNSVEVANIQFYRGGGGSTGYTVFQAKGDNSMALQDIAKFGLNTSSTSEMAATFYNGIYINDTNTRLHEGGQNSLRIETSTGYIDIGSMNSSWVHFQANKNIYILPSSKVSVDGILEPYSNNTRTLGTDANYWSTTYTRKVDTDNTGSRDKLRVWNSGSYAIGMKNGYDYGHLGDNEFAMSFQMSNTAGRGWWWGDTSHSDNQGAMSLTTEGKAVIATSLSIGEGESITNPYSTPLSVVSKNSDTGTAGRALAQFVNEVDADLSQQKTFVDFVFKDTNTNEIPQVRIGAELGPNANADSQEKEGEGAFVVYTNNATGTGPTPTGLAERMRVDYRGYLGLGTSTPSTLLHVNGSGTVGRFQSSASYCDLLFTNSGGTGGFLNFGGTTSFNVYVGGGSSSNLEMSLTNTGNLTVSGDVIAYGSPSDIRLKENIKPVKNALDKVVKLNGVSFDWKDKEDALDKEGNPVKLKKWKKDIGFIAQEVKEVIPELVRENEEGMLSVRHQGIIPILVESIKELKQEIEELKKQIK